MSAPPEGINAANVTKWFVDHVPEVTTPLTFTLIAGGRSNLTFRVEDAEGRAWVLRRPPVHHVLPTAHDMVREHRLMTSLGPGRDPGAQDHRPVHRRGRQRAALLRHGVRRGPHPARRRPRPSRPSTRPPAGRWATTWPTTLAALHDVDPDAVGLGDLGRHEGYIERQLKRWSGQYAQMQVDGVDHGGLVERVGDELARRVPPQQRTSIVHGDYRMDNVVLDDRGEVRAILDWELCTLGDPLADLGLLMVYWADRGDAMLGARPLAHHRAGLLHPGRGDGALRRGRRISISRGSATTPRSGTGSWPASSRASMPATSPVPAPATRAASTPSRPRWPPWPRWPPTHWRRRHEPRRH